MMTHGDWYAWMAAVLAHSELSDAQKLVLIRIALHLNIRDQRSNPGLQTIAAGCRMSERTVRMAVARAVRVGVAGPPSYVAIEQPEVLRLAAPKTRNGGAGFSEPKPGTAVHETRNGGAEKPGTAVPPNNEENNEGNIGSAPDGFDEFWSAYPKREGRLEAQHAYRAAVHEGLATPAQLVAGAHQYAQVVAQDQWKWILSPAAWLRKRRWLDEPDTRAADARDAEFERRLAKLPPDVQADVRARVLAKVGGRR
jgi:hypothetical protein